MELNSEKLKNQKGIFSGYPWIGCQMGERSRILLQDLKIILKLKCFNNSKSISLVPGNVEKEFLSILQLQF